MACSPSGSTESWRDRIMGRWEGEERREPAVPLGWRNLAKRVESVTSLLALSGHLPRPKAGARDCGTTGLKAQSARRKAQGAGRGGPSRLSLTAYRLALTLFHLPFELECDLLMQTREAGSARRKAGSAKRSDEFWTVRRCDEETPESGSVRSGMFGAWRWVGKRAALNGASY
jgi:hypothetical protein